jgi:hypothetical protein
MMSKADESRVREIAERLEKAGVFSLEYNEDAQAVVETYLSNGKFLEHEIVSLRDPSPHVRVHNGGEIHPNTFLPEYGAGKRALSPDTRKDKI